MGAVAQSGVTEPALAIGRLASDNKLITRRRPVLQRVSVLNAGREPLRGRPAYNAKEGGRPFLLPFGDGRPSNRASAVDNTQYIEQVRNFFLYFASILYEAMPWVVLGAVLAGIVQEIPPRRAPAVMLALSALIVTVFVSPFTLLVSHGVVSLDPAVVIVCDWVNAAALAGAVLALLIACQPAVDHTLGFLGNRRYLSIFLSGMLGLVIPMCECGIIPLTRRLLRKGLPISCCVTYILSGPILNVVVLMTTYVAFSAREKDSNSPYQMSGLWMLGLRAALGFLVAFVVGLVVEQMQKKYGASLLKGLMVRKGREDEEKDQEVESRVPLTKRLGNITETALHDFVDISVFLIIGALIAAAAKVAIDPRTIARESEGKPTLAIAIMMAFAVVVTLCSEADAFVAASFGTLRPAAKLAFLVLGPMLDFKLIFMYTRIFRPKLMWTIILCVLLQVFVYSYITHVLWENLAPRYMPAPTAVAPK
jgi:uncharacterized membrane protein YraQ (UPF0718 family)